MTATTAVPASPVRNLIAGCLVALLTFGLCWLAAIAYWRAHGSDPGAVDMLLLLLIVPGALVGAAVMGFKFFTASAAAATPVRATPVVAATPAPLVALPLAILATAISSPHGASVEELAEALAGKQARPKLDATLVDDDGFPVTTARCDDADDKALQADITTWMSTNNLPACDGEHLRALVLATQVARELAGKAAALLQEGQTAPMLQLAPVLPSDWNTAQHHAAGLWLQHTVAQSGWPLARIALVPIPEANPVLLLAGLATRAPNAEVIALVIACASYVGETSVQAWTASDTLFTSRREHGKIPGEGAVGLLLTDKARAATAPLLAPIATARRPGSADTARGAVLALLADLAKNALAASHVNENAIAMIVADTGPRANRMLELMTVAHLAPQLDDEKDIVPFGHASGNCGAVSALSALALASHYAVERNGPVLWLSNEDPFQRCVAVVQP